MRNYAILFTDFRAETYSIIKYQKERKVTVDQAWKVLRQAQSNQEPRILNAYGTSIQFDEISTHPFPPNYVKDYQRIQKTIAKHELDFKRMTVIFNH